MQDNAMSKWLSPLMAFCLSFIIIATLAPITGIQIDRQLDFWMLWLATMLILALPICYLEIALAKRSKTTALQALSTLTREADASQKWRIVGWLSVIFIPFLAGAMLNNASNVLALAALDLAPNLLFIGLVIAALVLSLLPRQILLVITAIGVLASLILANVMGTALPAWQVTPVEFSEWGNATVLALVASGLGMGLYWQSSLSAVQQQDVASKTVLPIWIAQLLAVIVFAFFGGRDCSDCCIHPADGTRAVTATSASPCDSMGDYGCRHPDLGHSKCDTNVQRSLTALGLIDLFDLRALCGLDHEDQPFT